MRKKGVTLLAVMITIIVMVIFVSTIVTIASRTVVNTKNLDFVKEITLVESQMKEYVTRKSGKIDINDFPERELIVSELSTAAQAQFSPETQVDGKITLYEINLYKIGIEASSYGKKNTVTDVYLYSSQTQNVYYLAGYQVPVGEESVVYYTITGELSEIGR